MIVLETGHIIKHQIGDLVRVNMPSQECGYRVVGITLLAGHVVRYEVANDSGGLRNFYEFEIVPWDGTIDGLDGVVV